MVGTVPKEGFVKRVMLFVVIAAVGGMVVYLARRRMAGGKDREFREELETLPSLSS